jgi:hypothetical protein
MNQRVARLSALWGRVSSIAMVVYPGCSTPRTLRGVVPVVGLDVCRRGEKGHGRKDLNATTHDCSSSTTLCAWSRVHSKWVHSLLTFLVVFLEADNDAGAISTHVQAGAQYGTHLLWIVLLLLPVIR